MAQILNIQDITVAEWWDVVYPYAVMLEKNITTSPQEMNYQAVRQAQEILPEALMRVQQTVYPDRAAAMREYLIRAITYLIHAYQELDNGHITEVEFYYGSALTQCAQLHHELVNQGFAS